jgi:hypothetical protein
MVNSNIDKAAFIIAEPYVICEHPEVWEEQLKEYKKQSLATKKKIKEILSQGQCYPDIINGATKIDPEKWSKEAWKINGRTLAKCKECGATRFIGKKTKECLDCLDWKMSDLRK